MLRTHIAGSLLGLSLMIGCGGSNKPAPQVQTTPEPEAVVASDASTSVVAAEPELVSVPEQSEPGDPDFPRGAEAFAAIIVAAQNNDGDAWAKAEARLQELGVQATAALAARLDDENPVARELAAMFLAQIGPDTAPAADGLVKLLQDESTFARVNAAAALSTFEGYAEKVTPVLTGLLGDGDDNVRLTAAMSLRNVGPLATKAVPGLVRVLEDSNPQIRAAAATTLGGIGPAATKSLPALRQLGSDPDASVVAAASRAIRQIDESARAKTAEAIPASATE